ncbi:MAG TPA: circadian clock KaiB family protein [Chloroflexota bacterium]|jgi:circadian clock protein KaiB
MPKHLLKLYVTGQTPSSLRAIANIRSLFGDPLDKEYDLVVIDVLEHPHLAEEDRVLVTPTLIKQIPPPPRRVLGDLSDRERVLWGLHLPPRANGQEDPRGGAACFVPDDAPGSANRGGEAAGGAV